MIHTNKEFKTTETTEWLSENRIIFQVPQLLEKQHIWDFRARQLQRSLASVIKDPLLL